MMEWILENKVTFIILIGLIIFLICRDLLRWYLEKRIREMHKAHLIATEKRIEELMDGLHKDRVKLMQDLADADARFAALQKMEPNPKNPADAK